MKHKHIDLTEFEVKFTGNIATIEGYGSIFGNKDNQGDIVVAGAFKSSIKAALPVMLYQHKSDKIPGIWDAASEDTKGLHLRGRTIDTSLGRDVAEEIRSGAIKGLSIGYSVKSGGSEYERGARMLKDLDLFETSLVTFPANQMATITGVKNAPKTLRDFEAFLREEGYSREDATTIALRGFKAFSQDMREADQEKASGLITDISNLTNILRR